MMTHSKIHRQKAQELRKSNWWQAQITTQPCYYCQGRVNEKTATMDHIVPLSQGGKSTKGNVVVCCKECNTKKSSMNAVEWILYQEQMTNPEG